MSKKTIREALVFPGCLLKDLLLREIDEHDRLDLRETLLPCEEKVAALVQLNRSGAGGDEDAN